MTGFARSELTGPFGTLICEIRTVNHRFLDTSLRLPEACRALEPDLRQAAAKQLRRGKVDASVYHRAAGPSGALELDPPVLSRVLARLSEVSATVGSMAPYETRIDLVDVLRFPGVLREEVGDNDALLAGARSVFAKSLDQLVAARSREGERLAELIRQRCAGLRTLVTTVRGRLPEAHQRHKQKMLDRLRELGAEASNFDPGRIEQEVVLALARGDSAEELDRLEAHITECEHCLTGNEPAGRRLDFLMQEFNREANTLSSKSLDLDTTRAAVDMKVLIEQMREQVQNIE